MSALFQPLPLKSLELKNRLAVAPMCQYAAVDGIANDWHHIHYAGLARGGAGLVVVEATAVSPEGRITPKCLGIWNDEQAQQLAKVAHSIKQNGSVAGIQIAHAGRKASANIPWEGDDHIDSSNPQGWETIAPSAIAFGANLSKVPAEMTKDDIERVKQDFVAGAKRALEAGFEWLELHFAHGYLAQSFFSTHANQRTDEYGGNAEGRARFLLETFNAVREVWPEHLPLTIRLGVVEFDGNDEAMLQESVDMLNKMKGNGLDMVSVSVGFNTPTAQVPWGPAFLAPISERIRQQTGLPVASAWGIDKPEDAERVVAENQMDQVMIGKAYLADPHYTYRLAKALNVEKPSWCLPPSYAHWLERYSFADK